MSMIKSRANVDELLAMRESGMTLQKIGDQFCITRERVRQICKMYGVTNNKNKEKIEKPKEARYSESKGNTLAIEAKAHALSVGCKDPVTAFNAHRNNAKKRGIPFSLTFDQWWCYWKDMYHLRGIGGYHMCRYLDDGGYAVGNVSIETANKNHSDRKLSGKIKAQKQSRPYINNKTQKKAKEDMFVFESSFGRDPLEIVLQNEC